MSGHFKTNSYNTICNIWVEHKTKKMENVTTNSPSALEIQHEQIPAPSSSTSSRKEVGGWRAIKYIIGSSLLISQFILLLTNIIYAFHVADYFFALLSIPYDTKVMSRSRKWHRWVWYRIWRCTCSINTTLVAYSSLTWYKFGMVPPTLHQLPVHSFLILIWADSRPSFTAVWRLFS